MTKVRFLDPRCFFEVECADGGDTYPNVSIRLAGNIFLGARGEPEWRICDRQKALEIAHAIISTVRESQDKEKYNDRE